MDYIKLAEDLGIAYSTLMKWKGDHIDLHKSFTTLQREKIA